MNSLLAKVNQRSFGLRIYVRMAALFLIAVSIFGIIRILKVTPLIDASVRSNILVGGVWIFIGVMWLLPTRLLLGIPLFLRNLLFIAAIGFSLFVEINFLTANLGSAAPAQMILMFLVSTLILLLPAVIAFLLLLAEQKSRNPA